MQDSTLPDPPSPSFSQVIDGNVRQHYSSYQDALLAAAFSHGYLVSAEPADGAWIVEWRVSVS